MKATRWAAALTAALLASALVFPPAGAFTTAYGEDDGSQAAAVYARAAVREAYFCTSAEPSSAIFAVPYTYCVEIIYEEGEWYRARYAEDAGIYRAVYGYVRKEDFTLLNEAPDTVYLYKSVSVTFSQSSPGGLPAVDDITVTAAFYGSYYSGATGYSYVLCNGSFGYIAGANEDYPVIEPEEPEPPEREEPQKQSGANGIVAAVVIAAVAATAVALVALSAKKPKPRGRDDGAER